MKLTAAKFHKWFKQNKPIIVAGAYFVAMGLVAMGGKKPNRRTYTPRDYDLDEFAQEDDQNEPQSVYSFLGSPLQLILQDRIAEGYNRFVDAFLEAKEYHERRWGRPWNGREPIDIRASRDDRVSYNLVGRIINHMIKINGGLDIPDELRTSDYLERV